MTPPASAAAAVAASPRGPGGGDRGADLPTSIRFQPTATLLSFPALKAAPAAAPAAETAGSSAAATAAAAAAAAATDAPDAAEPAAAAAAAAAASRCCTGVKSSRAMVSSGAHTLVNAVNQGLTIQCFRLKSTRFVRENTGSYPSKLYKLSWKGTICRFRYIASRAER